MSTAEGDKFVLTYPRARLFSNCIMVTPSKKPIYSIASQSKSPFSTQPSSTTIFALSLSTSQPNTPEHSDESETSFFDDDSVVNHREAERALGKRTVATIRWRGSESSADDKLEVEIPNRGRSGSALVGPMRRNLQDILISTRLGDSTVLDVSGKMCQCDWVRKEPLVTELRLRATNALVMVICKDDLWKPTRPGCFHQTRLEIYPGTVAEYLSRVYKDQVDIPETCAQLDPARRAAILRQDILDEILIAFLLYRNFRERRIRLVPPPPTRLYTEGVHLLKKLCYYSPKNATVSLSPPVLPPIRHPSDIMIEK